jgi:hypothetical protein
MAAADLVKVRVEDDTSIGRSYSKKATLERGLGARRRLLRTRSFAPYADGSPAVLESFTLAKCHLSKATREEVLEYFHNTWALTDVLFSALRDDSVFYMVPDKLRRPLIFYFGHAAALYANKMHQAGLMGEWFSWEKWYTCRRVGLGALRAPLRADAAQRIYPTLR